MEKLSGKNVSSNTESELDALWAHHHAQWRDTSEVTTHWADASKIDPRLFDFEVSGDWWGVLVQEKITLLITREYEHFVMALSVVNDQPHMTYLPVPHPSGIAVKDGTVYLASTRNPNQVFELQPASTGMARPDIESDDDAGLFEHRPLLPTHAHFLPGCLYMHDLAFIGNTLHANSVGQNAIVSFDAQFKLHRAWWPKCIERDSKPVFDLNYLQLNSIAAGNSLEASYFSASCAELSEPRPGHPDFPVDKRGVIFSGATREPIATGLTRPHSARLHNGELWVDNSGYGEFGLIKDQKLSVTAKLPGWTRGLGFAGNTAFVGTSRVIPRFKQYAPGLDTDQSQCGVHAVDTASARVLGSITWPSGNQIFAIEALPSVLTSGFPFTAGLQRKLASERGLFYSFLIEDTLK